MRRRVLVVAADSYELRWIEAPDGCHFVKVAGGAGPRLAEAAMDAAGGDFNAVISTGMCGALDPALSAGEIFVATEVNGDITDCPLTRGYCRKGPLASVDRFIGSIAEKQNLFGKGFSAVEMEASAVLGRARRWKVPFYCIRAVSDTAGEEFALDLNAARDAAGRFRISGILRQAAGRPVAIVPELLRLRRNSEAAARALGAFIATCDF